MKILYFVGGLTISETFVYELVLGLQQSNQVKLISLSEPYYKERLDYEVIDIELPFNLSFYLSYIFDNRGKKLNYYFKKRKAVQRLKSHLSNYDVVYIEFGTNAVFALPALIESKIPFIVHFHGYDISSELSFQPYLRDVKSVFKHASYIVAASHHIKRLLVLNGCDESKVKVIRYGISVPEINIDSVNNKIIDFISIGRLTHKKNPIALLLAFNIVLKEMPLLKLNMVGDGPLKQECEDLVSKLDIAESVVFHGALSHKETMKLLIQSRIYVQHSVTSIRGDQEGFAISLAEAALFKIPVISTLHNGIPENVIDGKTGFLVREFDYETMGAKMLELVKNRDLANQMGINGRQHIMNMCKLNERVDAMNKLLKNSIRRE